MDYSGLAQELLLITLHIPKKKVRLDAEKSMNGQNLVLEYLFAHGSRAYPKAISDFMMVSTARIAVILRSLEGSGLVKRTPDPDDGRQIIVTLTDKGAALAEKYQDDALDKLTRMLEYLGPEDALNYVRIRKKLLKMDTGTQKTDLKSGFSVRTDNIMAVTEPQVSSI